MKYLPRASRPLVADSVEWLHPSLASHLMKGAQITPGLGCSRESNHLYRNFGMSFSPASLGPVPRVADPACASTIPARVCTIWFLWMPVGICCHCFVVAMLIVCGFNSDSPESEMTAVHFGLLLIILLMSLRSFVSDLGSPSDSPLSDVWSANICQLFSHPQKNLFQRKEFSF